MSVAVQNPYISARPGVCGGRPCIAETRIAVMDVVALTRRGYFPVEVVDAFPHLTLAQVHAALAYYYDHQTEVDASFAEEDRMVEAHRKADPGIA